MDSQTTTTPDPFGPSDESDVDSDDEEHRLKQLKKIVNKLEITNMEVQDLRKLEGFDIVFLCDDSGSMREVMSIDSKNVYDKPLTRWTDLIQNIKIVIQLAIALDQDGIDLYFLNRPGKKGVKDWHDIKDIFDNPPAGHTPLSDAILKIMMDKADSEKRVLIVIGTDGEPDDGNNGDNLKRFQQVLQTRDIDKFFVSILACSDDPRDVKYLEHLDRHVKHFDVSDDYNTERKEVLANKKTFKFTRGDYVTKVLLGPIQRNWHVLDGKADKKKCSVM